MVDSSGKITGYKTSIGGADTVFPFNTGNEEQYKNQLYEAMKYSGFVSSSMTWDQMLNILRQKYPQTLNLNLISGISWNYSGTSFINNGSSMSLSGKNVNGYAYSNGYVSIPNEVDHFLHIAASTNREKTGMPINIKFKVKNTSTWNPVISKQLFSNSGINTVVSLSSYKGKDVEIQIYSENNSPTSSYIMTISTLYISST